MMKKLSALLFGLSLISSQFYIFSSGKPQPAHFILVFSLVAFMVSKERFFLSGDNALKILFLFVFYQLFVNLIFSLIHEELQFILSAIYIIYGYFIFLLIVNLSRTKSNLFSDVSFYGLIAVFVLFFLAMLGFGEYKFSPRYNGYFNDPNQMAFWVLCVTSIILNINNDKIFFQFFVLVIAVTLIVLTASRSGLLGCSCLLLGYLIKYIDIKKMNSKTLLIYIFGLISMLGCVYYLLTADLDMVSFLATRAGDTDFEEQSRVRGYTRILEYPAYTIFGAGHGMELRFDENNLEIHSTWAGLFFYYGIFGLLLVIMFVFFMAKKLSLSENCFLFAPLLYSFSTFGLRTPIFWIFIGVFYAYSKTKSGR